MNRVLPTHLEQYQELVQKLQWLLYDANKLSQAEYSNLERAMQYVQARIKLTYFQILYRESEERRYLNSKLEEKQASVDKLLTDKYCNKSLLSTFGSKTSQDLYDSYYSDLKSYQRILEFDFFENLTSELIEQSNVDDLKTLCEEILGTNITENFEVIYNILNHNELEKNVKNCVEERKNVSYLKYIIKELENTIKDLQFILDNYAQLSDFQNKVDQLSNEKLSMSRDRISKLKLNKAALELELKELEKIRKKYRDSNIFMKLFKYRENKKNDIEFSKLLITISGVENEEESYTSHLEQLIKEAREELIAYIKAEDSTLFQEYIDRIQKCSKPLEIVDSKDFFIYNLYSYDELVRQQQLKKDSLELLKKKYEESKSHYNKSMSIYRYIIGENTNILDRIVEIQNLLSINDMKLIICIYILKLIYDTENLSVSDMLCLLDKEDMAKLQDEYKQLVGVYLELEKTHIDNLYFNYKFKKDTGYYDEDNLGFAKIKI